MRLTATLTALGAAAVLSAGIATAMADEVTTKTTTTRTDTGVVTDAPPPVGVIVEDHPDCSKKVVTKTDEATGDTMTKKSVRCD